jgi:hypothetical protein
MRGRTGVAAVLDGWEPAGAVQQGAGACRMADLDQREADAGISARHPILVDPKYQIDPVLARFLAASRFTWLAEGTR